MIQNMTLAQIRKRLSRMTQAERADIAKRIGLSFSAVQKVATGHRKDVVLSTFLALEKVLKR